MFPSHSSPMSGVPFSAGRANLSSPSRRPSISGGISTSGVSPRGARRLSLDLTAAATPSSVDEIRARLHDVMRSIDDTLLDAEASLFASSGSHSLRPPRRLSSAAATAALATSGVEAEEAYVVRHDPHHARAEREARRAELTALSRLPPTHPIASVSTGGSAGAVAGGVHKTGTPLPCSSSSRSPSPSSPSSSAASASSWEPHAQVLSQEAHERHAGRLGVSAAHRVDRLYSAEEAARVLSAAGESAAVVVAGTGGSEDDAGDANSATTGMSDTYKATLDYWRADGHRSLHRFLKQGKLQSAHAKATRHSGGDAAVEPQGEEQMPESMAKQSVPYRPRFASTASAVSATSTHTTASKYQKPSSARLGVPGTATATARGEGAADGGGGGRVFSGMVGEGVGGVHYGGASNTVTDTLTSTCVSTHHSTSASSTASEERATVAAANAQHREPPLTALESLRGAAPVASSSSSLPPPQLHTNTTTAAAPVTGAPVETKRIAVSDSGPPPPGAADAVAASVPPAAITPSPAVALPSPAFVPSLSARLAALRAADAAQRFPASSWAVGRGAGGVDDALSHAVSPPTAQYSDAYVPEAAEGLTFAATASAHVDPHTRPAAATTQREPGAACRRLDGLGSLPSPPRPQQPAPRLTRPRSGDDTTLSEVRPAAPLPPLGTSRWREAPCGINASRLTDALVRSPDTSREASPNTKWTAEERRGRRDGRHEETAYIVELAQQRQAAAEEAWRQGQRGVDDAAPRRPRSLLAVSSLAEGSGVRLGVVGGAGGGLDGSASTSHGSFTRGGRGDPQHYPLLSTAPLDALQARLTSLSVKEAEQRPRLTSTQSLRAHDERYDDDDGDGGAAVVMRQAAAFARRVDARDADASRHLEEEVAHHTAVQVDAQARVARVEAGVPARERRAAAAALAEEVSAIRAHAAQLEKLRRHMRQEVGASSPPPLLPERPSKDMKAASLPPPPPPQQQQKEHAVPHSRAVPERNVAHVFAGATDTTSTTSSLNIPEVAPSPHRSRLGESSRTSPSRGQSESRPRRAVPLPPPLPEATTATSGAVTAMSAATALWSTAVEVEEEGYEDADGAAAAAVVAACGRGGGGGRGEGASSDLSSVSATSLDDREAAGTPERASPSRLRMTERPEPTARAAAAAAAVRRRDAAATQTEEPRSLMARDSAGAARSETGQADGGPSHKTKGRAVAEDDTEDENTQQDWLTATQRPFRQVRSVASPRDTAVGEGDVGDTEKRTAEAQRTSATTAPAAEPPSPLPTNPASHQRFRPPPRRPAGDEAGNQRSATAVDGHVPPDGSGDELPSPHDRPSLSVEDAERDVVSSSPSAEPHRYASLSPERLAAIQSTQLHVSPTRDPAWRRGLEPSHHHRHRHGDASARRGRAFTSPPSSSSSSLRSSSTCEGRHTVALRSPTATSRHSKLANVQSQRPSLLGSGPPSQPPSPVPPPSQRSAEASAWRTAGQHHQHQHRSGEEMTEEQQREEEKEQQQRQQHQTSRQALNTATALKARAMLAKHGLHVTVQLAGHRLPAVVKLSEDGQELLFFLERVAEATSMATRYDAHNDAAAADDGSGIGSGSGGQVQEGRGATHGGTPRSRSAGASALSPRAAVSAPRSAPSSSSSSFLMHGGQQSAHQPAVSPRGSPAGQRQPLGSRAPSSLLAHGAEPYRPLTSPNFQNPNTPHSTSALPLPLAVPVPQQAMAGSRSMSLYSVSPSVHLRHPPASVAAPTVVPAATAKPATPPPPPGFVKAPAGAVLHKVPPPHLSGSAAAPSVPPLRIPPPQLRATLLLQPPDASLTSPSPSSSLTPPPHPLPRHAPAASPRTASSSPAAPRLVRVRERHHFPCGNARLYVPYGVMGHERDVGMGGPETWEDVSSVLCGPASFEVLRRYGCPLFAHMRGKAYAPYRLFVIIPEFTRIDVPQDAVLLVLDFAQRVDWVLFLLAMQRSVADRTTRLELGERGRLTRERSGSRDAAAGRRAPPPVLSYGRALWMLAVQRLHRAQALRGLNPFESRVAARQTDGGASATPPRQRAVSLRDVQEARRHDTPHGSTPSAAHAVSSRTASPQPAAGTQERRQQPLRVQSAPLPLERVGSGLQGSRRRTATPAEATAAHLHRSPRDGRVHAAQLSGPAASGLPPGLRRVPHPHEQTAALAAHPTSSFSRGGQGDGPPAPARGSGNGGRSPPHPTGRVALTAQQQQQQQQYTSTIDLRNAQTVDQPSRGSENVHPMYAEETSKPRFRWLKHVASTLNSSRRNSVTAKTAVVPE